MRRRDGSPNLKKIALILTLLIFSTGCSEAVLNADQCSDARNAVKRFYSFHFGNDMTPSDRGLEIRTRFLSKGLADRLTKDKNSSTDFFTQSEEFPTAFRVGKCEMRSEDSALLEVFALLEIR